MTAAFWDKIAEKYASKPVEDPEAFDRKIAITKTLMSPDSVVLDIGCGTGSLALRLADSGGHIHGLDVSSEMTRIARGKARAQAVENVTFYTGPFDESFSAFGDSSLDGICAYSILHLLEDRREALARIFDLLKPGGFFVSSTVCLGSSRLFYAPLVGLMRLLGKAPMVKFFSAQTLTQEISAAGFVEVERRDVGAKSNIAFLTARKPSRPS